MEFLEVCHSAIDAVGWAPDFWTIFLESPVLRRGVGAIIMGLGELGKGIEKVSEKLERMQDPKPPPRARLNLLRHTPSLKPHARSVEALPVLKLCSAEASSPSHCRDKSLTKWSRPSELMTQTP